MSGTLPAPVRLAFAFTDIEGSTRWSPSTPAYTAPRRSSSLIIAFLAGRQHPFHLAALAIMERMDRGGVRLIVTPIVVAEVIWSARSALGRPRTEAAALLLDVLESDGFEVLERAIVRRALELLVAHPRLDLAA